MENARAIRITLALAGTLAISLSGGLAYVSLAGGGNNEDAIHAAEKRVAAERGMTVDELRTQISNECFKRIQNQEIEESTGGIFTAQDARQAAEYACSDIAIVGPRDLKNAK